MRSYQILYLNPRTMIIMMIPAAILIPPLNPMMMGSMMIKTVENETIYVFHL